MGCVEGDFEKGEGNGANGSAELVQRLARVRSQLSDAAKTA
jgi:hypothetical protein